VILLDGELVGEAHNEVLVTHDPTAHAELLAIRRASQTLGRADLTGCVLYTNVEPCCMCMASALWANISTVHYAMGMQASTAIGLGDLHFYEELARPTDERRIIPLVHHPEHAAQALTVTTIRSEA
jgi:guanine deaminase